MLIRLATESGLL